jgi:hypothetical protein
MTRLAAQEVADAKALGDLSEDLLWWYVGARFPVRVKAPRPAGPVVKPPGGAPAAAAGGRAATAQSVADKLRTYLLNPAHPKGGSKAKWFKEALGFTEQNLDDLAKQITFNPATAVETAVTQFGTKYNQVIEIVGANGRRIGVTFAWIKNNDGVVRLVTAIPTKL